MCVRHGVSPRDGEIRVSVCGERGALVCCGGATASRQVDRGRRVCGRRVCGLCGGRMGKAR